jgi:hypothetical protein
VRPEHLLATEGHILGRKIMAKVWLIKDGKRERLMVRGRCGRDLIAIEDYSRVKLGYRRVGVVAFWKHVLLWWRKKK